MTIIYTEEAIENLDDIYYYLAVERDNTDYAKRYLSAIDDTIKQLEIFPLMGSPRDNWKEGLRILIHNNHVITYIFDKDHSLITVLSILHGKQDIERKYRDD